MHTMLARAACVRERALVRFFLGAREDGSCLPACLPRRGRREGTEKSHLYYQHGVIISASSRKLHVSIFSIFSFIACPLFGA